jgi:ADP-ribosyl-[dinitrogen reductase] hydrolase
MLDGRDVRQVYLTDDHGNLDVGAVLDDVLATVSAARAEQRPVLVHCFAGASRTGLVLRAWLMRKEGLGVSAATERALEIWPTTSTWNDDFTHALKLAERSA